MTAKGKTYRGLPALLPLLATFALHALALGWALHGGGSGPDAVRPVPIRIEMLPGSWTVPASGSAGSPPQQQSSVTPPLKTAPPIDLRQPKAVSREREVPVSGDQLALDGAGARMPTLPGVQDIDIQAGAQADDFAPPVDDPEITDRGEPSGVQTTAGSTADRGEDPAGQRPSSDTQSPTPFSAEGRWRYRVYYGDFAANNQVATLDYVLRIDQERYRLHTEGQAIGLLALFYRGLFSQASEGRFGPEGFGAERYQERRGDRSARVVEIADHEGMRSVTFDDGRVEQTSAMAQDRLSLGAQLAWLAARQSVRLREPELVIPLIGVSSIRTLRFQVARDQMLEVPGRVMQLIRLRSEDGDGERPGNVEIWLSEAGELMPIRIRLEDRNGQVLDQLIRID